MLNHQTAVLSLSKESDEKHLKERWFMRKLFLFLPFLIVVAVSARTPPPLPPILPPQTPCCPPVRKPPDPAVPHTQPLTKEALDRLPVSSSTYRIMLTYLIQHGLVPGMSITTESTPSSATGGLTRASSAAAPATVHRFHAAPLTTVQYVEQIDGDSNQDWEPSTIVQRYPAGGADYPIVAYMKFPVPNNATPLIHARSTTDRVDKTLAVSAGRTRAYDHTADPVLAENPYSGGVNAKWVYCVGTMYNFGTYNIGDTAIPIWYSPDAGTTWYGPYPILSYADGSGWFLDKPTIDVSWASTSLGVTYVAFVQVPLAGGNSMIQVYRLGQNGTTFQWASTPVAGGNIQSPQLVVDPNDGGVYLLWINFIAHTINIMHSADQGHSFVNQYSFTAPNMLANGFDNICDNTNHTTCVQARTTLDAVWNNYDLSLGVVWHARETTDLNAHTDVYFNRYAAYAVPYPYWTGIKQVNHTTTNDQWHGAFDVNDIGQYIVAYYDRRNYYNNVYYQVFATEIDAAGNRLPTSTTDDQLIYEQNVLSNILYYSAIWGINNRSYSLGEYQAMWYWYGTWYGATVYIPSTTGDIYAPRITLP
jgi:hypothetical protein